MREVCAPGVLPLPSAPADNDRYAARHGAEYATNQRGGQLGEAASHIMDAQTPAEGVVTRPPFWLSGRNSPATIPCRNCARRSARMTSTPPSGSLESRCGPHLNYDVEPERHVPTGSFPGANIAGPGRDDHGQRTVLRPELPAVGWMRYRRKAGWRVVAALR